MQLKSGIRLGVLLSIKLVCYGAVQVPKSSLEPLRQQVQSELAVALKAQDQPAIKQAQTELAELDRKITKFEREWLTYKKHKLTTHLQPTKTISVAPAATNNTVSAPPTATTNQLAKLPAPKVSSTSGPSDPAVVELAEIEKLLKSYE